MAEARARRKPRKSARKAPARARAADPLKAAAVFFRQLGRDALAVGVGLLCGAGLLVGLLYHQARKDVNRALSGPVWSTSGRVMGAPLELWPGLALSAEQIAQELQGAGYARVHRAEKPGDFAVEGGSILLRVPEQVGAGWKTAKVDLRIRVEEGRIAAISPRSRVQLAPVELQSLRGESNEARRVVGLTELPRHLIDAVLAMEDARFREHEGLDPIGLTRALFINLWKGGTLQGGSTITQQVVKNLLLTQERTWQRKAREALLAVALERERSKDEILALYLNEIYLGQAGGAAVCGVEQAARAYFGKSAARLSLGEAATLAGIVSAPNRYSPLQRPELAIERRDIALDRMVAVGWLDARRAAAEKRQPLEVHPGITSRRAPWAVDSAVDLAEQELGEGAVLARGLTLNTTIQSPLQRLAEQAVAEGGEELDRLHPRAAGAQIALAALRASDGAVVAMVGGRDYGQSQFNRALHSERQVGSTVKPLTYLAALEADTALWPLSPIEDAPLERHVDGKRWAPQNYDGRYLGRISLRTALAQSRNIPAVLLAERVGMGELERWWKGLGLEAATRRPSAALGSFGATPVQLAGAYTVFPGQGSWAKPRLLRGAVDADGVALIKGGEREARAASARAAFLATRLMIAVMEEGTGKKARGYGVGSGAAGKTGTTDNARDAWFVGYTPELVVAVWVGFDKGRDLGLTGGEAALPTWARFVAATGLSGASFPVPGGLEKVKVCAQSLGLAGASCPLGLEDYSSHRPEPCAEHGGLLEQRAAQREAPAEGRPGVLERLRRRLGG